MDRDANVGDVGHDNGEDADPPPPNQLAIYDGGGDSDANDKDPPPPNQLASKYLQNMNISSLDLEDGLEDLRVLPTARIAKSNALLSLSLLQSSSPIAPGNTANSQDSQRGEGDDHGDMNEQGQRKVTGWGDFEDEDFIPPDEFGEESSIKDFEDGDGGSAEDLDEIEEWNDPPSKKVRNTLKKDKTLTLNTHRPLPQRGNSVLLTRERPRKMRRWRKFWNGRTSLQKR